MKVLFIAAGLYHHISEITDRFYQHYGEDFRFFSTEAEVRESVRIMGHTQDLERRPYHININDGPKQKSLLDFWCANAEICIIGCGGCDKYITKRVQTHKLTFKLKERLFKHGLTKAKKQLYTEEVERYYQPNFNQNFYILCIGHYCSHDLYSIGFPKGKLLKWGYFPWFDTRYSRKVSHIEGTPIQIGWVGRLISEKQPFMPIEMIEYLLSNRKNVHLEMVGYGEMEAEIRKYIQQKGLEGHVELLSPMPEWKIRTLMRRWDWYVFSSSPWEGWGVVLSEAMSEGCLCIASEQAGASLELIDDCQNGYIFNGFDQSSLNSVALRVSELEPDLWLQIGNTAVETIRSKWNPIRCTDILIDVLDGYLNAGKLIFPESGVCAPACIEPYREKEE